MKSTFMVEYEKDCLVSTHTYNPKGFHRCAWRRGAQVTLVTLVVGAFICRLLALVKPTTLFVEKVENIWTGLRYIPSVTLHLWVVYHFQLLSRHVRKSKMEGKMKRPNICLKVTPLLHKAFAAIQADAVKGSKFHAHFVRLDRDDRELLQIYKVFHDIDTVMTEESEGSEWIIRFELDKQTMMDKNITMYLT